MVNAISNGESKAAFLFIPFLFLCLVTYLIGRAINVKFNRLGLTPLTMSSAMITKGVKHQASILVKKHDFSCVHSIQLKCLITRYSTSGGTVLPEVIFEKDNPCEIKSSNGGTVLSFAYEIPNDLPSSSDETAKMSIDWQFSFKFRDGIEEVSRSWSFKVK